MRMMNLTPNDVRIRIDADTLALRLACSRPVVDVDALPAPEHGLILITSAGVARAARRPDVVSLDVTSPDGVADGLVSWVAA